MSESKPEIKTLADIARLQSRERPNDVAMILGNDTTTYAELEDGSNRIANGLLTLGIQPDQRVCYLGKNAPDYFELIMGISKAGGVMCPINWRLAGPEVAYILNDAEAPLIFVGPEFEDLVDGIKQDVPKLQKVIPLKDLDSWKAEFASTDPGIARAFDDDAIQLYTSGTTGYPKGVRMANRGILAARARDASDEAPIWNSWSSDDVGLVAMPCFHIGGTGFGLQILYNGAKGVIMPEFDAHQVLGKIKDHKISKLFMVPAALQIVLNEPNVREVDFSQLNYISYGASPIPLDLLKTCMEVFGCEFVQKYGMTETCGTCVALPPDDHSPDGTPKMKSVGKPLPGIEIRIIDENGNDVECGAVGEIAIRSETNMTGYWRNEEATAKTFLEGGWLRSGDAGFLDEDGYLYIHDRVKDMIISGGENIYPAEVENAIFSHPKVKDVAVFGVPDDKWGEAVKASVVIENGQSVSEQEIIEFARSRIARFKCPKSIDFIDQLPRNPSGKVLKRELRAPYWSGKTRSVN